MDKISKLPDTFLSDQQKNAFTKFSENIAEWKQYLINTGYEVIVLNEYKVEDTQNSLRYPGAGGAWDSIFSCEGAVESNILFIAGTFVSASQFSSGKYWPDTLGHDLVPKYVEAVFSINNTARVYLTGETGIELFDTKNYSSSLTDSSISGTWLEIAKILLAIRKEIAGNLKIEKVPVV